LRQSKTNMKPSAAFATSFVHRLTNRAVRYH
jgi:hypothetical protein